MSLTIVFVKSVTISGDIFMWRFSWDRFLPWGAWLWR